MILPEGSKPAQIQQDIRDMLRGLDTYSDVSAVYEKYNGMPVIYPALGLAGETGEYVDKVKKLLRDNGGRIDQDARVELIKELGDILWYLAKSARDLNTKLSVVALGNLEKLESRKQRGVLQGSGDNR